MFHARVAVPVAVGMTLGLIFAFSPERGPASPAQRAESLTSLLPEMPGWVLAEDVQTYLPETLFEYINGAAESYLSYEFRQLVVGQFKKKDGPDMLTVEVYDMGLLRNAFGIYSAERYPESRFIQAGVQGYLEEGSLNCFAGRYYLKLLCFECGQEAEKVLRPAAESVVSKIADPAGFPAVLAAFPREGLVANSEKFIRQNFLGMSFLEFGYTAQYRLEDREFECIIIEAGSEDRALAMLRQFFSQAEEKKESAADTEPLLSWRDKYLKNIFIMQTGSYLCGLIRLPDGMEKNALSYVREMAGALGRSLKRE